MLTLLAHSGIRCFSLWSMHTPSGQRWLRWSPPPHPPLYMSFAGCSQPMAYRNSWYLTMGLNLPRWNLKSFLKEMEWNSSTVPLTFKRAMRISDQHGPSFPQRLQNFLLTYRTTPHATTNETPSTLFLGRHVRTRLDLMYPTLEGHGSQQASSAEAPTWSTCVEEVPVCWAASYSKELQTRNSVGSRNHHWKEPDQCHI